mmetsp:Transcript_34856/g.69256  ORF Transcript_34856/g.69256 Transcript_34856/m.69256 type:complete len:153 (-) Transcript_34856:333-791(-)
MYHEKFGKQRMDQMVPMITKRFSEVGVTYSLGGLTGNTMDSHRLLTHALSVGGEALQDKLVEELFMNYFSEEKFLGDKEVLLAAATKVGVPGAEAVINDKAACLDEVKKDLQTYTKGISGVPHFIVDGQYGMGGAQPPEAFAEIFETIANDC